MQLTEFISEKKRSLLLVLLIFGAGLVSGIIIQRYLAAIDRTSSERSFEIREKGYKFTNPLLECEIAKDTIGDREIKPFKEKILALIASAMRDNRATFISVYFRDLNNGPWFGINEREIFAPASLLKVPVMIAYFKLAESNPGLLNKKITYTGGDDRNALEYFKPPQSLSPGRAYTVDELITRMIAYSDNNAKDLLMSNLNPAILAKVYMDLGVKMPTTKVARDFLPVKSYASFFRVLFNASYLNREFSEKALHYLSEVTFTRGLAAGIPNSVPIAHKFGEHSQPDDPRMKQLHDCGIIYFPNSPYLLCVMTRGNDLETLAGTIRDISSLVYEELSGQEKMQDETFLFGPEGISLENATEGGRK